MTDKPTFEPQGNLAPLSGVIEGEWSDKQLAYIFYLVDTGGLTAEQFAKNIDITVVSLWHWKKLEGFMDDVRRVRDAYFSDNDYFVDSKLADTALDGNVPAMRLYYERHGIINKAGISVTVDDDREVDITIKVIRPKNVDDEDEECQ